MTESIYSKLLMPWLGVCQCTVLPENSECQSQLLETGQRGIITLVTKVGVMIYFTEIEEKLLVDHVKYLASTGYVYIQSGMQYMA